MTADALSGGFADPVLQSQAVFRAVLGVLSRPGTIAQLAHPVRPPRPLNAAAAALLCTLADNDTPVFLDRRLAEHEAVATWIGFHTGARPIAGPADAAFAVIGDPDGMPPLADFRQGTDDYPDRSTTLIVQIKSFTGEPLVLAGPGIPDTAQLKLNPMPGDLTRQLADNRRRFPCGVDLIFASPDAIAALPRSARVVEPGER